MRKTPRNLRGRKFGLSDVHHEESFKFYLQVFNYRIANIERIIDSCEFDQVMLVRYSVVLGALE